MIVDVESIGGLGAVASCEHDEPIFYSPTARVGPADVGALLQAGLTLGTLTAEASTGAARGWAELEVLDWSGAELAAFVIPDADALRWCIETAGLGLVGTSCFPCAEQSETWLHRIALRGPR